MDYMTVEEYLVKRKSPDWKFNTIIDRESFQHVNKIHPLKQKLVRDIVQAARNDEAVKRIIVFGSSTRYDCDIASDLDLCIDWKYDCYDEEGVLCKCQYKNALCRVGEDNAYLDVVCFEAQQANEFLIKAILLEHGIAYNKTHDI